MNHKILIVDDTPANLDILRVTLNRKGHEISIAPNGEIALELVNQFYPDLILLDIMMPGIDGYETCKRIKANPLTSHIPVIFISAKYDPEDIMKGFHVGGVDYITKPFNSNEVEVRVKTQLSIQSLIKQKEALVQTLEEKNRKLKTLNEDKNYFLGMASHDLRGPLSTIKGFSEILLTTDKPLNASDTQEIINTIKNVSQNMLGLVNDLLDYSVIESGKLELKKKFESINKVLLERVRVNQIIADRKNIKLDINIEEISNFPFDANRVIQIIDNIIGNAIKFSPKSTTIWITSKMADNKCKISIKDEGPGISEEDQKLLFKGFQKLSARPTGGEKSTGLGLAIVKRMIKAHNGTLEVRSTLGKGSEFTFTLIMAE